eukprot:GHVS01103554.1.p1 GENE.GHVS01103554.1~~GHVS01103554.1.p1  ORF type:complete len:469 (+),score=141.83 GHVS01103554.1:97-1407(+)
MDLSLCAAAAANGATSTTTSTTTSGNTTSNNSGSSSSFGVYHFVTRQKRHMIEQLLRNRSCYLTQFNTPDTQRNRKSPFILKQIPNPILEGLHKMSNDFDDPEFTGVWLSLHTPPFMTDTQFGNLARSKIVGWALIEVLTTNERCLKALWIHPKLSPSSATFLLRGFLPRVLLEAFQLDAPSDSSCSWKFFYTWANDFESLPRQTWLFLTSRKWLGLPRHFDVNSAQHADHVERRAAVEGEGVEEGKKKGGEEPIKREEQGGSSGGGGRVVVDGPQKRSEVSISSSVCGCMKNPKWTRVDEVLVGCSEASLYTKWSAGGFLHFIPEVTDPGLVDDIQDLPNDTASDDNSKDETEEVLRKEELVGLGDEDVARLLKYIWGAEDAKQRVRGLDEIIKTVVVEDAGGTGENIKRAKVKPQRGGGGGGGKKKKGRLFKGS